MPESGLIIVPASTSTVVPASAPASTGSGSSSTGCGQPVSSKRTSGS